MRKQYLQLQHFLLAMLSLVASAGIAQTNQPLVSLKQENIGHQAFIHCTLVVSPDEIIQDATLLIDNGLVVAAGKNISIPHNAIIRNMHGLWIYPGFIDAYSHQGLIPVKKTAPPTPPVPQYLSKRSGPYSWNDAVNSHQTAENQLRTGLILRDSLFKNGFTTLHIVPNDGIFQGTSMLIVPSSQSQTVLNASVGMGISFDKGSSMQEYPQSLMGSIALMRQTFSDAIWYRDAIKAYEKNPNQPKYTENLSFDAIQKALTANKMFFFESNSCQNTLRAAAIAREFGVNMVYTTAGDEYRQFEEFIKIKPFLIVSPDFPQALRPETPADERNIPLEYLRNWEQAPFLLRRLIEAGIPFALSTSQMKTSGDFWGNLREAKAAGADEKKLLEALTSAPAKLLGAEKQLGSLEVGKIANFVVTSGNIFEENNAIYEVFTLGERHIIQDLPREDIRGEYRISLRDTTVQMQIVGQLVSPKILLNGQEHPFTQRDGAIYLLYPTPDSPEISLSLVYMGEKGFSGYIEDKNGRKEDLEVPMIQPFKEAPIGVQPAVAAPALPALAFPGKAFGKTKIPAQGRFIIRNATVWTNTEKGILQQTDVLIENGKIAEIGPGLQAPQGTTEIPGAGKHLTPGIIDEHSHIAISGAVNEDSHAVTAEVRIGDVLDPDDADIYRQLAGGVTTAQLLHGSANPIGGQSAIIRLRWGQSAENLRFDYGKEPKFIKFALGENVKQSNAGDGFSQRYPQTRMGVEQSIKEAFRRAKEYRAAQDLWEQSRRRDHIIPPRPDLQLEAIAEILEGNRNITCHSYVQSEITMLIRLAEAEGFKVNTFTHVLEGFKIPEKIKAHGATASSFADWWAYKFEVYDVTAYNPAMLNERGLNVCINSDDAEMARRLNQEAGKSIKYGGMSEEDALKMVTLNPARALHIDNKVGSIAPGKDADLVLWSNHPLSIYARAEKTFIEGRCYYNLEEDLQQRATQAAERARLLAQMRAAAGGNSPKVVQGFGLHKLRYQCCQAGH